MTQAQGEAYMRKTTYIQAINEAMKDEMRRDPSVFLIGEDIGAYGGLFRVTRNLLDEFGGNRVIDTPISEQGLWAWPSARRWWGCARSSS
jgi:pyruvate/2-oxoglutarate/acetoin dehydrogenase E1 component